MERRVVRLGEFGVSVSLFGRVIESEAMAREAIWPLIDDEKGLDGEEITHGVVRVGVGVGEDIVGRGR